MSKIGPLAITSCSCVYSIVSVITPPVYAILLFAGIRNNQLVCQKLFSHGNCINSKSFYTLCDCLNVVLLRLYKLTIREKHKAGQLLVWQHCVCWFVARSMHSLAMHFLKQLAGDCRQSRANGAN